MQRRNSLLDLIASNPRGWGNTPGPASEVAYEDDAGNLYDFGGNVVQRYSAPQEQSWGDMAYGVGTAPARMTMGLLDSVNPYGEDGWRIPPAVNAMYDAARATGDAYEGNLSRSEMNDQAFNLAGFLMGGGLAAPRSAAIRDYAQSTYRAARYPHERSAFSYDTDPDLANDMFRIVASNSRGPDWRRPHFKNDFSVVDAKHFESPSNETAQLRKSDMPYLNALAAQQARGGFSVIDGDIFSNANPYAGLLPALEEDEPYNDLYRY